MRFLGVFLMVLVGVGGWAQSSPFDASTARIEHTYLTESVASGPLNYRTLAEQFPDSSEPWHFWLPATWTSYNTSAPYGINDGDLWQGRGLNVATRAGLRWTMMGVSITLLPALTYEQNLPFDLVPSAYPSPFGYPWSLKKDRGADAPQRMGDTSRWALNWGDSEIRLTWNTLTLGFGTQSPWVGPGQGTSLLHSTNAATYPKVDLGLRRTSVQLGSLALGDIEARLWAGYLSESLFFDKNQSNDHNLLSALSLAFSPSLVTGLELSFNRSYVSKWKPESAATLPSLFVVNVNGIGSDDIWDQRLGIGVRYRLPESTAELYGEMAYNDFPAQDVLGILRNFEHTTAYLAGFRKGFRVTADVSGEVGYEWTNSEMRSAYAQFQWPTSFYMHHQIEQGYTNAGQWLGMGIGAGGNSQQLNARLFARDLQVLVSVWRYNVDNDFIVRKTVKTTTTGPDYDMADFKSVVAFDLAIEQRLFTQWVVQWGAGLAQIQNPTYQGTWLNPQILWNGRLTLGVRWSP